MRNDLLNTWKSIIVTDTPHCFYCSAITPQSYSTGSPSFHVRVNTISIKIHLIILVSWKTHFEYPLSSRAGQIGRSKIKRHFKYSITIKGYFLSEVVWRSNQLFKHQAYNSTQQQKPILL